MINLEDKVYAMLQEERQRPHKMREHEDPTTVIMDPLPSLAAAVDEVQVQDEA